MRLLTRSALSAILLVASMLAARSAFAQAGSLDPTFGSGGTAIASFGSTGVGLIDALQVQSNGDILVLVESGANNELLRYTPSGQLDTTFGNKGVAVVSPPLAGMAQQSNGEIVLAGILSNSNGNFLAVSRLTSSGVPDTTFGNGGLGIASLGNRGTNVGQAVLVQPNDGKIVACQTLEPIGRRQPFQVLLARFNSNGQLDATFGTNGVVVATGANGCTSLAELTTGGYLVVDSQRVAQFAANGSVVSPVVGGPVVAFDQNVSVFTNSIFEANGDYLFGEDLFVGEESRGHNSSVEVLRFTGTGTEDSTFTPTSFHFVGQGGSNIEALVSALAVAPNGDIAVAGHQIMFSRNGNTTVNGLARLTSNGTLDAAFGNGGIVSNNIPEGSGGFAAVAVQPGGDIVVAGITSASQLFLSRYRGQ